MDNIKGELITANTIDWRRKLTSRKFWAAIADFVTMLIIAFRGTQELAIQVTAIIMAGAGVVAYIVGEGLTDAAAIKNNSSQEQIGPYFGPAEEDDDE